MLELYRAGEFDVVTLIYSQIQIGGHPELTAQLIPAMVDASGPACDHCYEYEPDEETILEALYPEHLGGAVAGSPARQPGRFASQMAAMDNATRNAGDLINALTIKMNRTRQAQITKGVD